MRRFPQEAGVVGGERVDHAHQGVAATVADHMPVVFFEGLEAPLTHAFPQPGGYQFFFALAKIQAKLVIRQTPDGLEFMRLEALDPDRRGHLRNRRLTHGRVP
jgi:hypothetical protein